MAPLKPFHLVYLLSTILLINCIVEQSTAFTLELIHRFGPDSPFYDANLSYPEITERLNFRTRASKQKKLFTLIKKRNETSFHLKAIRPSFDIDLQQSAFIVKVSLGTFSSRSSSHKSYYLDFDTGSELTWLQCEDCKKHPHQCYRQIEPPYPNSKSSSYRPLPCDQHRLCIPGKCIGNSCSYHVNYAGASNSIGILAKEMFAFPSTSGHNENVPLVFGCGIDNKGSYLQDEDLKVAGIFGMGWGPRSFVTQVHSVSHGKFSYCFPSIHQAVQGLPVFLRLGSDIPLYSTLPSTRLMSYEPEQSYYVNLLDMSINNVRLNIPSAYFRKGGHNIGGCIFDTGTTITHVSRQAYQMLKQAVERHIARTETSLVKVGAMLGYDLCYSRRKPVVGHRNLPSVTFHFDGNADLVVKPETSFYINSQNIHYEYICLAMIPCDGDRITIIGSYTQANQFFVYDIPSKRLHFGSRDCSRNP
uniref:Peptidase A1 domain-containing protein n=1 Tax=Kalanchoe fedtschenkoi TaxID=63787 RepID=A0A7N0UQA0_KALFE